MTSSSSRQSAMNLRCGTVYTRMILLHVAMSLDGFIAGPGHDMSWTGGAEYDTSSQFADTEPPPGTAQ
jgi:hypothetical protein